MLEEYAQHDQHVSHQGSTCGVSPLDVMMGILYICRLKLPCLTTSSFLTGLTHQLTTSEDPDMTDDGSLNVRNPIARHGGINGARRDRIKEVGETESVARGGHVDQ
jgi:hypothetical protein